MDSNVPKPKFVSRLPARNAKVTPTPAPTSRPLLRRRSKSVTDLRNVPSKRYNILKPLSENMAPVRVPLKRPLASVSAKANDEPKPKISKAKIPDWDYKSRFNQAQERLTKANKDLKDAQEQSASAAEYQKRIVLLEQELNTMTHERDIKNIAIEQFTTNEKQMLSQLEDQKNEIQCLRCERDELSLSLSKTDEKYNSILGEFTALSIVHQGISSELERFKSISESQRASIITYQSEIARQDVKRRILHNTIQDLKGNIRVFCRVRPPGDDVQPICSLLYPDEATLEIRKLKESVANSGSTELRQAFNFDKVFPPNTEQSEVFTELADLVQSALDGYNVCVFAYGQTGSGKTFTMQGTAANQGLIPRTVDFIFQKIAELESLGWKHKVSASFIEIYNDQVLDLLVNDVSSVKPKTCYNEGRGITVSNLKVVPVTSPQELRKIMEKANRNRATAATDFNEHSSRSHAIAKIELSGIAQNGDCFSGSINLVDLAGSESAKTSNRMAETKNINKSLSILGNVMLALHRKDKHIPYRDSKLTFLLQSSLGGNSKTLMFVNIAPFESCYGESLSALRFASSVKQVKLNAKKQRNAAI